MPRQPRIDYVGAWKHITNRGLAKRPVFENRADMRYFLACVARAVRAGLIEVHAYCILVTHFHLLARSPMGQLGEAMRRIENRYVRWFNRRRRRDGPMLRGRYNGVLIESAAHWQATVLYIDDNPVKAGLCSNSARYPYCSTFHHLQPRQPPWLAGEEVLRILQEARDGLSSTARESIEHLVVSRLSRPHSVPVDLDDLVRASPARVRDWMIRKAKLADGTRPGMAVAQPGTLGGLLRARSVAEPHRRVGNGRQRTPFWGAMEAGLLRTACGLGYAEISARMGIPVSTAHNRVERHMRLVREFAEYAEEAGRLVSEAIERDFGWMSTGTPWVEIRSRGTRSADDS